MPGLGIVLGAEFLAATGGDMTVFGTADRLAGFSGVAPVPRNAGKTSGNLRRPQRYNRRLQRVFYSSALFSIRHCEESRRFHDRKRAQGKRHTQAVIAPDGSWLATAGNGKSVRIWDHGFALTSSRTPGGHTGPVKEVAIALDSSWLATTSDDRKVRIWDRTSGICTAVLTGHTGSVNAVGIAPDGSWLATTSSVRRYLMAALERCRGPRHRLSGAVWHQRRRKDGAYVV